MNPLNATTPATIQLEIQLLGLSHGLALLVDEVNRILTALNAPRRYVLTPVPVDGTEIVPPTWPAEATEKKTKQFRVSRSKNARSGWTPKRRAAQAARMKRVTATVRASGSDNGHKRPGRDEIIAWAKKHDNVFDIEQFKERNPDVSLKGALGGVIASGAFKRIGLSKRYTYREKFDSTEAQSATA